MALPNHQKNRDHANFKDPSSPALADNTERLVHDADSLAALQALSGTANTTTTISNPVITLKNIENSFTLPANTKKFQVKARGPLPARLQLAYTSGDSGTLYITIDPGQSFIDDQFHTTQTLYIQSSKDATTIEIIAYV